jgi:hypothetical protein
VILDSTFHLEGSHITSAALESLRCQLSDSLQGRRYGFLAEGVFANGADVNEHPSGHELNDLYAWVKCATDVRV